MEIVIILLQFINIICLLYGFIHLYRIFNARINNSLNSSDRQKENQYKKLTEKVCRNNEMIIQKLDMLGQKEITIDRVYKQIDKNIDKIFKKRQHFYDENVKELLSLLTEKVDVITDNLSRIQSNQDIAVSVSDKLPKEGNNESKYNIVQYNDAVAEFVKINEKIYNLRKYYDILPYLFSYLAGDFFNKTKCRQIIDLYNDDNLKGLCSAVVDDIRNFMTYRKQSIDNYIKKYDLVYADVVRYPYNGLFDSELDDHILGDDVQNGDHIIRVCKLGYYFPDSNVCPYRVKSKVVTEDKIG